MHQSHVAPLYETPALQGNIDLAYSPKGTLGRLNLRAHLIVANAEPSKALLNEDSQRDMIQRPLVHVIVEGRVGDI